MKGHSPAVLGLGKPPTGLALVADSTRLALVGLVAALLAAPALVVAARAQAGDLDTSFGNAGKVTTDLGFGSRAFAVALQADGKIVAAGAGSGGFALVRYLPDGSLDQTFDADGIVTTAIGPFGQAFAVALQPDGRIVAAGAVAPSGYCCSFALARYNSDGGLDASFDGDGIVTTSFGGDAEARALVLQPDGKILVAGFTYSPFGGFFALARYNSNGGLDTSFDGDGTLTTNFGGTYAEVSGIALEPDGRIVVAGSNDGDFALARYHPNGALDASFDGDGTLTTDFGGTDRAEGIALQADGRIVAAGVGGSFFALARYTADGGLDTSFDGDGQVTIVFVGENIESAKDVAVDASGRIVAAGSAFFNYGGSFAVARFLSDGSLDPAFGVGGKVTTVFGERGSDGAEGVALQANGRIVAAGGAGPCTPPCQFALARYLGDALVIEVPLEVTTDTTLTEDHQGPIVIAADSVTLDCGEHTVKGGGTGIGIGIHLDGRSGATVTGCVVTGFAQGIVVENSSRNSIARNTVRQNADVGIRLASSDRNTVIGNTVSDNAGGPFAANGIVLSASSHNEVSFNTVTGTESTGIPIVDGSAWNRLVGNVSSNNGATGFDLIDVSRNTLSRNIAVGNGDAGFRLRGGSQRNTLRDNTACLNTPADAIEERGRRGPGNVWANNLICSE